MTFKETVCILDPKGGNQFPERFENEIYFVEDLKAKFSPLSYVSNFSLKCVFAGEEHYVVNNARKQVRSGQLLMVNNQSEVTRISSRGTSFSIFLGADLLSECYRSLTMSDQQLLDAPLTEKSNELKLFDDVIPGHLDFLVHLKASLKANPDLIIPADYYFEIGQQLLLHQNDLLRQIDRLDRGKLATRQEVFKRLNRARHYLNDTLCEKFNLNELSRISMLSKFQLIRDFKRAFGTTPHRYFILKKLALAHEMIQSQPHLSLQEIAFQLNYSSLSSFSRQFKSVYGVSPRGVR